MNTDWMKSPTWLANAGHFLAGMCVLETARLFSAHAVVLAFVSAAFVVYALLKEYWWDLTYETGEDVASSTEDFFGYVIGHAVAWGLVVWAGGLLP